MKKILSVIMCFVIMATSLFIVAVAEETKYSGKVNVNDGSSLTVRSDATAKADSLGVLYKNDTVTIHGRVINGSDGRKWYKIEYNGGFAYVCADYVKDVTEIKPPVQYQPDASFEENMTAQNFPESYKVLLRQLHAAHPEWIFLADHINLTWAEVFAAESAVGKSLVSISRPESYRSMEYGAYSWTSNSYVGFDGASWVSAHKDIVAYYLEPRNFLNENGIFQFLDQSYNENFQNVAGVEKIIANSFMGNAFPESTYSSYAELLMDAGRQSKVSPYVLAAMIIQEQGRGGESGSISGSYGSGLSNYFNHFNIGAYEVKENGVLKYTAVQRGLMYARGDFASAANKQKYGLPWNTRAKSIIGGAIWFGSGYIEVGQDTLYYKKWDLIGPNFYNHQYMTNVQAAYSESLIMKEAYAEIADSTALIFSIPVFKDMPETNTTSLPSSNGANNYYLDSLSVEGYSISNFNKYTNSYELVVANEVSSINVIATAVPGATVSGTGQRALNVGANSIAVTVTAASGKTADYIIYVTRIGEGDTSAIPTPEISASYNIGTYLTGVSPETSVDAFKSKITVSNGTVRILNSSGQEKTGGNIATGDKVVVSKTNGEEYLKKDIVIYGDINSDGSINIIDLALVKKHILKKTIQQGVNASGADANKDGSINIIDLAVVKKHILKKALITQ